VLVHLQNPHAQLLGRVGTEKPFGRKIEMP
jgi:hypothetical protein